MKTVIFPRALSAVGSVDWCTWARLLAQFRGGGQVSTSCDTYQPLSVVSRSCGRRLRLCQVALHNFLHHARQLTSSFHGGGRSI